MIMSIPDSRRDFVKKSLYVAPAIVTVAVAPAYAKAGSEKPDSKDDPDRRHDRPKQQKSRVGDREPDQ